MTNLTLILFSFIFLVTKNILLLNEESLILICFIVFVVLGLNNLTASVNQYFTNQSLQIENLIRSSLKQVLDLLNELLTLKSSFKTALNNFIVLKHYYFTLINLITSFISNYHKTSLSTSYKTRLIFLKRIEDQTFKLLVLVLLKKLTKLVYLKRFYSSNCKILQFVCLSKILLRERIQLIKLKSN